MAVILITHDLGVVAEVADRVKVMYAGRIVEAGTVDQIFYDPQHPYTWGCSARSPRPDRPRASGSPRSPGSRRRCSPCRRAAISAPAAPTPSIGARRRPALEVAAARRATPIAAGSRRAEEGPAVVETADIGLEAPAA